jgi:serine/threonine-protein kinase
VAGQVQEYAREQLINQGLKPNIKSVPSPDNPQIPAGQAIRTEPAANTQVSKGSQIDLYISKGPAQVQVPNLAGKSQAEAQQALLVANLTLAPSPTFTPTFDPNQVDKVIDQSPKAGQSVPGQTPVTITIGQKQAGVKVPADIIGAREDDARNELEDLGLTVNSTRVDGPGEPDTVYDTDPKPGKDVAVNGTVTLMISRGNEELMPNVVGKSVDDAKRALKDAGVRSSNIVVQRVSVNDPSQADRVVKQSPNPDQGVPDGDVTLLVGDYGG